MSLHFNIYAEMKKLRYLFFLLLPLMAFSQVSSVKIAVLKYNGGGDWYSNPTSVPNLITFCNENLKTTIHPEPGIVEPGSADLFNYAYVDMTGHTIFAAPAGTQQAGTFVSGYAPIKVNGKWGVIDKSGEITVVPVYDKMEVV